MIKNHTNFSAGIYHLKVNNRNTRTRCEICSKLTIKITEPRLRQGQLKCYVCQVYGLLKKLTKNADPDKYRYSGYVI